MISIVCFGLKTKTLKNSQDELCLACNISLICSGCFLPFSMGDKLLLVSVLLGLMETLGTGTFSSCHALPYSFPFPAQIIKSLGICTENGIALGLQNSEVNLIKCRYPSTGSCVCAGDLGSGGIREALQGIFLPNSA